MENEKKEDAKKNTAKWLQLSVPSSSISNERDP